jgi:hypothetical protein
MSACLAMGYSHKWQSPSPAFFDENEAASRLNLMRFVAAKAL